MSPASASAGFFDFDALDELEDALGASCTPGEAATDTTGESCEDDLSEVWPGDIVGDVAAELRGCLEPGGGAAAKAGGREEEEEEAVLWEIVWSRVAIRAEPRIDARVAGICSRFELVAEERDDTNPDWVRLAQGRGFILKDGRQKDPKLGLLLQRYEATGVPPHCRTQVSRLLRTVWMEARAQSHYLGPGHVKALHKAAEDATARATAPGGEFDVKAFELAFEGQARAVLEAKALGQPPGAQAAAQAENGQHAWNYEAPVVREKGGKITPASVRQLLINMQNRRLPSTEDTLAILGRAAELFAKQPSLVHLQVPYSATLHIVGDIHGQYWDLLHMMEEYGDPTSTNQYLFNGDFVDRGSFSVEVAIALLAMKVAAPNAVHLNRGNHESIRMNAIYGFMAETKRKYNEDVFNLFCEAFRCLPLATVVNHSVFVVHGGLGSSESMRLDDIAKLDRKKEPDELADALMLELLWSDPMGAAGFQRSPRGGGVLFGPDVTRRFCADNGLICVVRSHEMKQDGFEWHHEQMCLTIFSAPNYCGICGNLGAVCDVTPRRGQPRVSLSDMKVRTFEATDPPADVNAQAMGMGMGMGMGGFP